MAIIDYLPNYKEHPTKEHYLVFQFTKVKAASTFEESLTQEGIPFEKDEMEHGIDIIYMYGIRTTYRKKAVQLNFLALAKHRKPLVQNKMIRIMLLSFFFLVILVIILGILNK